MATTGFGSGTSSGFGKGSGGSFAPYTGGGGSSGSSTLLGNLGKDLVSTVEGFGPGLLQTIEHPNKTGQAILKNYESTYGPLAQGNFSGFYKNFREHPLGPILDATAFFDAGASLAGKGVNAAAKAGVIGEDSNLLRNLGYKSGVRLNQLPGVEGSGFETATAANPLRRARENLVHSVMQKLPTQMKFIGTGAQYARSLRKVGTYSTANEINLLARQAKAFDALKGTTERTVANGIGQGIEFGTGKGSTLAHLHSVNPDFEIPHETIQAYSNPDVIDLAKRVKQQVQTGSVTDKDVARVLDYNTASKAASDADAAIKIKSGSLNKEQATIRPYLHSIVQKGGRWLPKEDIIQTEDGRLVHISTEGKKIGKNGTPTPKSVEGGEEIGRDLVTGKKVDLQTLPESETLTPTEAHDAILHTGYNKNVEYGWMNPKGGAFDVDKLAEDLANSGHPGVHYVPDKTIFRNENAGGTRGQNAATEATRGTPTNALETYYHGQLLLNQNLLGRELLGSIHVAKANAVFDQLMEHGVKTGPKNLDDVLTKGAKPDYGPPEKGFVYLKPRKEAENPTDFLDQSRPEFSRLMGEAPGIKQKLTDYYKVGDPRESTTFNPLEAAYEGGGLTQVPLHVVQQASKEIRQSQQGIQSLLHKPTVVWKDFVLATRPGFLTTNVVGNSLLYALRHAGPEGAWSLGRTLFNSSDKGEGKLYSGISKSWVDDNMPEQAIENTHTNTQIINREYASSNFQRAFNKWLTTLYGLNAKHEGMLRRASIDAGARSLPEIKERLKWVDQGVKNGRINLNGKSKIEYAIQTAPEAVRRKISSMTDDVMGNYRDFSQGEQYMKELVPFYAWNRHATRTTLSILHNRPGVAALSADVGNQGAIANQQLLGDVPEFMRAYGALDVHIPGVPHGPGRETVLNTASINPFATVLDTAEAAKSLVSGKPGGDNSQLGSAISPFLQSIVQQFSGKSLLSGGPVKNDAGGGFLGALISPYLSTAQVQIGEKLLGLSAPESPGTVTSHDWTTTGLNFLGTPIKNVNVSASQSWQKKRETAAKAAYTLVKNG